MNQENSKKVGIYAATLSLVEAFIGSQLHAWHVPMAGTWLSLNQGLLLTHLTKHSKKADRSWRNSVHVSYIAALLKSLSPVGKKLTPMLAIGIQGVLFSLGIAMFGPTLVGVIAGSILLSLWGVIQPLALTAIVYGFVFDSKSIEAIFEYYVRLFRDFAFVDISKLYLLVIAFILLKGLIAACLALFAWKSKNNYIDRQLAKATALSLVESDLATEHSELQKAEISQLPNPSLLPPSSDTFTKLQSIFKATFGAIKDVMQLYVLLPTLFTFLFFYFHDSHHSHAIWMALRPLAVTYILFFLIRILPFDKIILKLRNKSPEFSDALKILRRKIKKTKA